MPPVSKMLAKQSARLGEKRFGVQATLNYGVMADTKLIVERRRPAMSS